MIEIPFLNGLAIAIGTLLNGYLDRRQRAKHTLAQSTTISGLSLEARQAFDTEEFERQYNTRIKLAAYERQTALAAETYRDLLRKLPWHTPAEAVLQRYRECAQLGERLPLFVIVSPPVIEHDPYASSIRHIQTVESDVELGLHSFFDILNASNRPTMYLSGLWESKRYRGEAAAETLFYVFRNIPVLLLQCDAGPEALTIRASTWGLMEGDAKPTHRVLVPRLEYRALLNQFAKEDAAKWKADRELLRRMGRSATDLVSLGGEHERNMTLLEQEIEDRANGIERRRQYEINYDHDKRLAHLLALCLGMTVGVTADIYHFVNFHDNPALPRVLREQKYPVLMAEAARPVLESLITSYARAYATTTNQHASWIPDMYLDLAQFAATSGFTRVAKELTDSSLDGWRVLNQQVSDQPLTETFRSAIRTRDFRFLKRLKAVYELMDEHEIAGVISMLLFAEVPPLDII
jgi:hypothetical protein